MQKKRIKNGNYRALRKMAKRSKELLNNYCRKYGNYKYPNRERVRVLAKYINVDKIMDEIVEGIKCVE